MSTSSTGGQPDPERMLSAALRAQAKGNAASEDPPGTGSGPPEQQRAPGKRQQRRLPVLGVLLYALLLGIVVGVVAGVISLW